MLLLSVSSLTRAQDPSPIVSRLNQFVSIPTLSSLTNFNPFESFSSSASPANAGGKLFDLDTEASEKKLSFSPNPARNLFRRRKPLGGN